MREELSVLYVALTRAVYSLQMIIAADGANDSADDAGQPKRSPASKKLPSTIAGLIRAALTDPQPLEANQRVFEHGCADWLQRLPRAQVRQAAGLPVAPPKVALRSAASKGRAGAAPTLRPSQLEGSGRVRLADRLNAPVRSAMERGTLIHAFFEAIEWLEDGLPDDDTLTEIGIALDASPQQLASTITDFRAMLALPSIRQVLTRQRYQTWLDEGAAPEPADLRLEVRREQPITARDDDNWLTGNIDRLVLLCRQGQPLAAEILDFKTDAVPTPETLNQRVEFYRPQLQAYRRGVGRMLRIDTTRITMALLFVSNGRLVPLST
jgi:ATP-dependent exoDNAse (exonuclease V) beta subunit